MEASPPNPRANADAGLLTERRISWLTPLLGLLSGAAIYLEHHHDWAAGIVIGSILAWLNFRWLQKGISALIASSAAQQGLETPRVPLLTYFVAAFRYALLALAVYAIFVYLHVPLVSLILGLCALGAAAIVASVWEVLHPAD